MPDMVLLTDAELDLVAGGDISQYNTSYITQYATAHSTNYGDVTADAYGAYSVAVAVGSAASATNLAVVDQSNSVG
jgi:hypothetical protein